MRASVTKVIYLTHLRAYSRSEECGMSEVIDNKANRVRILKDIIKHLHAGNPPEQVREQMREIVRQTDTPKSLPWTAD